MKIKALTTFLDGTDRYEIGDIRSIGDEKANYFVSQGWAIDQNGLAEEPFEGDVALAVKNGKLNLHE
jgi:hypothetical protein